MKDTSVRVSCRVSENLAKEAQKLATKKRWSMQVLLEEALIQFVRDEKNHV